METSDLPTAPHADCPFAGMNPDLVVGARDRILIGDGAARGLRLHLTVRDLVAVGVMLVSLTGVWYSLGAKVDRLESKVVAHLDDPDIHPGVLARQALIDSRLASANERDTANFRRLEEQIADLKTDIRELKESMKARRP